MRYSWLLLPLLACGCPRQSNVTEPSAVAAAQRSAPASQPPLKPSDAVEHKPVVVTAPGKPIKLQPKSVTPAPALHAANAGIALPLPYLAPGVGIHPAAVPDSVLSQLTGSKEFSADKSVAKVAVTTGQTTWLQSFTTAAKPKEIAQFYGGILRAKGFKETPDNGSPLQGAEFVAAWTASEGLYTARIYTMGAAASTAGNGVAQYSYVLALEQHTAVAGVAK